MEKRKSAIARIVAVLALAAAIAAVFLVVSSGVKKDDSSKSGTKPHHAKQQQQQEKPPRTKAKVYEVTPGETLTAISRKTGVPVFEITALNPEVDPLGLQSGEILKLR